MQRCISVNYAWTTWILLPGTRSTLLASVTCKMRLSEEDYREMQRLWRILGPAYEAMWIRVEQNNRKKKQALDVSDVKNSPKWVLSPEELNFQKMTNTVTVREQAHIYPVVNYLLHLASKYLPGGKLFTAFIGGYQGGVCRATATHRDIRRG